MVIKLIEIKFENFRSWVELNLTDIDSCGLTLVEAPNGMGKSSIRQGIEYLLTDTTSDDIPLDDLPFNKTAACKLYAKLDYDGKIVEITKYRNHPKYINSSIVYVDGVDKQPMADRRAVQNYINKLFDITPELVAVSTIFTQRSLSFADSKDSDRKKILYDANKLNEYPARVDLAKAEIDELGRSYTKLQNKIESLKDTQEAREEDLTNFRACRLSFEADKKIVIDRKKKKLSDITLDDVPGTKQLEDLKASLMDVDPLRKKGNRLLLQYNELIKTQVEHNTKLKELVPNRTTCPILDRHCDILGMEFEEANKIYSNKKIDLTEKLSCVKLELSQLKEAIDLINSTIEENNNKIKQIEEIEDGINEVNSINEIRKTEIEQIKLSIIEEEQKQNPYIELEKSTLNKIEILKESVGKLEKEMESITDTISYYEFWKKGFSPTGIPNIKSEEFIYSLETETNNILSSSDIHLLVEISGQKQLKSKTFVEKIDYKVLNRETNITNFKSYSSGQQQRIKIADIFAFNSLLSKFNFIILDEVLSLSLDEAGKENVMDFLRQQASKFGAVFVMSHSSQIKDKFDNVLSVRLENGESRLV
ncbi:MAG: hypothetical protein ABIJ08_05865 [Nanoarchaeota archaeon]